jgi:molybdopterin-guanine dinucleotide biosynthesis protein A
VIPVEYTGVILAGGKSRRLDYRNKALLQIGDKTIIERVVDVLSKVTEKIILITNSPQEFKFLKLPILGDIIPNSGPIGGIYTGLKESETHQNIVVACDMPFIQPQLLEFLVCQSKGYDITIPLTTDGYHPLCAVYSKNCIEPIETLIETHSLKVTNLFQYVKVREVMFDTQHPYYTLNMFLNVNTEEDYLKATHIMKTIIVSDYF